MSQSNIVMYMEEELSIEKLNTVLSKFDAKVQMSSWGMERSNSWIWVNYYNLEDHDEIRNIWFEISKETLKNSKNSNVKTALFIQPSRDRNAVFFALSFCEEICAILDSDKDVFLYHGDSGLFANDEIENLQFMNCQQFYDSRLINDEIVEGMIQCLNEELVGGIECIEEDGGWDGEELQYIDLFKNLFEMREQLKHQINRIPQSFKEELSHVDELILKFMEIDDDNLLITAGDEKRDTPINSWWWHLDKVITRSLKIHIKEGFVNYQGRNIDM
ncbi:hypothetical protein [Paenibacillus sp. QZ-Y1]|uniref:hypothetical protein n=1 Tax=Paenibacillus sp. QZ-Y1 TaxID=3414511 RepID=UPI003F7A24DA